MTTKSHKSSSKNISSSMLSTAKAFRAASSLTDKANRLFLEAFSDNELANSLLRSYNAGDFASVVSTEIDPNSYSREDRYKFRDDFCVASYFSKNRYFELPYDKDERAYAKFWKFEDLCKATNLRFQNLGRDPEFTGARVWLLNAAIRKISSVLGSFDVDKWLDSCGWGPGVTRSVKGKSTSAPIKYSFENGITPDLYYSMFSLFKEAWPSWLGRKTISNDRLCGLTLYEGNALCTVPKNAKINRVIAIEPGLNVFVQKGIGKLIRRSMRTSGIDLNDASRNIEMARQGSIDGSFATVDFSSASDSIARLVVRELLSGSDPRWFQIMDLTRSRFGRLKDAGGEKVIYWEKFSSMGNGFTWELESLIFYAAACATCEYLDIEPNVSVFGDDVVLPNSAYAVFVDFCEFLGFRVNTEKSFNSGSFRESCGSFWFDGLDCKPYFQKEALSHVESIYRMANGLRLLAHRRNNYYGCDDRLRTCWLNLLCRVPKSLRLFVPRSLGDVGFVGNFDEATPALDRKVTGSRPVYQQYAVRHLAVKPKTVFHEEVGVLLSALDSLQSKDPGPTLPAYGAKALRAFALSHSAAVPHGNEPSLRDVTRRVVQRTSVNGWYNLGDWI